MITIVVGHRGAGKSKFLERVVAYHGALGQEVHAFDLDREIERRSQKTIEQIFSESGEAGFRELEQQCFRQVYADAQAVKGSAFVAVGGGFVEGLKGPLPFGSQILWVRRPSDRAGRIFIDRPRLDSEMAPLEEFLARFATREALFQRIHHRQITIPEGWDHLNDFEPTLLGLKPAALNASMTVLPEHLGNPLRLEDFIQNKLQMGLRYFELRDDLLSDDQIEMLTKELPSEKVLISFRRRKTSERLKRLSAPFATDWALELGPSPFDHNKIISVHERFDGESIDEVVERLKGVKADHYKLAVPVHDYIELWSGHRFFKEDSARHSFLPNSPNGRWSWYRLIQHKNMHLNFVRDGVEGSSADQPVIFDFLRYPEKAVGFAAVLGSPIGHSHTPAEQSRFFGEKNIGVVAIDMPEVDCHSLSFSILERLGMRAAAVTSPLKMLAARICVHLDKKSDELGAINTMLHTSNGWLGTNTDVLGLEAMLKSLELPPTVAVWGGGGTRLVLKSLLPKAHFFSARMGKEIWVERAEPEFNPELLVWALGRSRVEGSEKPPANWRPNYILDLNYSEDSPGLEYALQTGAKYISGRAFFKAQASAQRDFWAREIKD